MNYEMVGIVLGALFFIAGGLATLYKFMITLRKERDEENLKVLATAKEHADSELRQAKTELNSKIEKLQSELSHQRDVHEGKVSELSEKIEQLREEMRRHHHQLLDLLSKVWSKDE